MADGGCLLAVTFYGSARVVEHYNLMGPVKAALESSMRYIAAELGPKGIRAHAISPGPIRTRAARRHRSVRRTTRNGGGSCAGAPSR